MRFYLMNPVGNDENFRDFKRHLNDLNILYFSMVGTDNLRHEESTICR
jgi:hypothetical protein